MRRILSRVVALLLVAWLASGCLASRRIVNMTDHPSGKVTLLETHDYYQYVFVQSFKRVFWRCVNSDAGLTCQKLCDGDNDLDCAPVGSLSSGRR